MVRFLCRGFKDNVPVISDGEIDDYAEEIIEEYNPLLLQVPTAVNSFDFLERYFKLDIQFAHIFHKINDSLILGAISFNDGQLIKIFNKEKHRAEHVRLDRGSVILDDSLSAEDMQARLLFTVLHECGHWSMHQDFYSPLTGSGIICCRKKDVEPAVGRRRFTMPAEFLEHQANMFASAIAMPRRIIRKIMPGIFLSLSKSDEFSGCSGQDFVAGEVAQLFGVSRRAAKIRLLKLGYFTE